MVQLSMLVRRGWLVLLLRLTEVWCRLRLVVTAGFLELLVTSTG